jgi:protection-of-telomeres protein 1
VTLADIINPRLIVRGLESVRGYLSPFTVCKYRANVRVVGYYPPKIEDFAVGRRISEFDILSDYSGGEDTDPEEDMRSFKSGKGFAKKNWEWRFALEVVDASSSTKPSTERIWLMVDNFSAQMLLNMDATK